MKAPLFYLLPLLGMLSAPLQAAWSPERHPVFEPSIKPEQSDQGNLFLNAKVEASGTFENQVPGLAVDGKVDPDKHWTAENLPVWLQIDMGSEQSLSTIRFWPYWKDGRIYKYKIEGSTDAKSWTMLADQSANSITGTAEGNLLTFKPVKVRYVKVTILDNSNGKANGGHIVEIKGYAQPMSGALNASAVTMNERVAPTGEPATANRLKGVTETAWRGERVNGQIALWSDSDIRDMTLASNGLKGPGGATLPVKTSFVRYTLAKGKPTADIIDPVTMLDLPGGTTRTVWVSVDVPATAAPGVYSGEVVVRARGAEPAKVPVFINVLPPVLRPVAEWSCHVDLWQHPESVARYHGVESWSDEHFALMKPVMKLLADAGQKTITCSLIHEAWNEQTYDWWPSMVEWIKRPDGKMTYDYAKFDRWVSFMLDEVGLDGTLTCYTMVPWSLKLRYYDQATGLYETAVLKPGDQSYEDLWGPFLKDFCNHLKEKGWFERACIGLDERPDYMVRAAKEIVDKYAPGLKVISAINHPTDTTADLYDVSICFRDSNTVPKSLSDERRAKGWKSTVYVCCNPPKPNTFTDSVLAESEWLGLFAAANHFDGFLRWAYNSWNRDPFESADFGNWRPGDCFLVYPGGRSTLRFEKLRDGFEEFEKITMLREQAASPGASDQLKQAVAEMDRILAERFTIQKGFGDQQAADLAPAREAISKAAAALAK